MTRFGNVSLSELPASYSAPVIIFQILQQRGQCPKAAVSFAAQLRALNTIPA